MATSDKINVLTEEFLQDLLNTTLENSYVLSVVCDHIEEEHLPDRNSAAVLKIIKRHYRKYGKAPSYTMVQQSLVGNRGALKFWKQAYDDGAIFETDECLGLLEDYLKHVEFLKIFKNAGNVFNREGLEGAQQMVANYVDWSRTFSLTGSDYTDVVSTFGSRHQKNRVKNNARGGERLLARFYIDELDNLNQDRDLREQLSCILAPTGVGKSHAARWIGSQACLDGFNVLHFQLEGSREEVENAYSAALVACNAYSYEKGYIKKEDMERFEKEISEVSGKLFVRSYPKFNQNVSTLNIKEAVAEFKKNYNVTPDIVIVDSADLLTDSSGRKYGESGERLKRVSVFNDLKDLATELKVWMVVTYQARIENPDWINDEKNVLTEHSSAEAKGIARPCSHLITLNQSANERREKTMRLHVAKSRFFPKGDTIKIAIDYDNEKFFDRQRTANL